MLELSAASRAYLAGIIDGEGCIGIRRTKMTGSMKSIRYGAVVIVGSTSRTLIEQLVRTLGVGCVTYRFPTRRSKGCYVWTIQSRNARDVLQLLQPFLVVKSEQAACLIEFVDRFESFKGGRPGRFGGQTISTDELARRSALYQRMRALNKVGPGAPSKVVSGKKSRGMTAEFYPTI